MSVSGDYSIGPGQAAMDPAATERPADERSRIKAAAEKFEGFFIGQLLREMRRSTREMAGEDSVYRNTVDADMIDIADVALGDSLASQHAFGVADAILRQLLPAGDTAATSKTAAAFKGAPDPVASNEMTSLFPEAASKEVTSLHTEVGPKEGDEPPY